MAQQNSDSVFKAKARSLNELFTMRGSIAGFRIPTYQRPYDWGKKNIKRLFEDVLSGLFWCSEDPKSLTFLGTVIVLEEVNREPHFDGVSFSVIDGQQRLTTISIVACALFARIKELENTVSEIGLTENTRDWVRNEMNYIKTRLLNFAYGQLPVDGATNFPFPRIVREEVRDNRANNPRYSEYNSVIADFLFTFSNYVKDGKDTFGEVFEFPDNPMGKAIEKNKKVIDELIEEVSSTNEASISANLPTMKELQKNGFRLLFEKLPKDQTDTNKIFSELKKEEDKVIGLMRLMVFSSFFMSRVVITLVEVRNEKYGFDIFDSLNTTGEPLTAVQTFKPQVIRYENTRKTFVGSESEEHFKIIEEYLNVFESNSRQKAAKELIVSFFLYKTGDRVSMNLDEQRRYLRNKYDEIDSAYNKNLFVKNLKEVALYRKLFWKDKTELEAQISSYPNREQVLLCLNFLRELKNSLTIPILCRYYYLSIEKNDKRLFTDAVKCVTAFVAIRRSFTGNTGGIDSDLRGIMLTGKKKKKNDNSNIEPVCIGLGSSGSPLNSAVNTLTLKEHLKDWLSKKGITNKESWVKKVVSQPLYTYSASLCKFLILAAVHHSRVDADASADKLIKSKPSMETDYLKFDIWSRQDVSTVEHIAPQSRKNTDWDPDIYSQPYLVHCLGNLTLLPAEENSAVGNKKWSNKKKLYKAFAAKTQSEVDAIIEEAKSVGFNFHKKTLEILKEKGLHLPLAESISTIDDWSKEIIESRSTNIAELAWDEISPWLFDV